MLEYGLTGARMMRRGQGEEERPPVGIQALPATVLPDMYGSTQLGSFPLFPERQGNQLESSSASYAGLLATLVAAPLAWCDRRRRTMNIFWMLLGFLGLAWCLDIPGLVAIGRLPLLNMMSFNRFVYVTSLAILAMAAVGLDVLSTTDVRRQWWFCIPLATLAALLVWCVHRMFDLPEPLASQLAMAIEQGKQIFWLHDARDLQSCVANFIRGYSIAAVLCAIGIAAWLLLWSGSQWRAHLLPLLGVLWVADMVCFAYGRRRSAIPSFIFLRSRRSRPWLRRNRDAWWASTACRRRSISFAVLATSAVTTRSIQAG